MHVMEACVDLSECPVMSNVLVNLDFTLEIIWIRGLVHISTGKFSDTDLQRDPEFQYGPWLLRMPNPSMFVQWPIGSCKDISWLSSYNLKSEPKDVRARGNFLASSCDTNDSGNTPSFMTSLESRSHNVYLHKSIKRASYCNFWVRTFPVQSKV